MNFRNIIQVDNMNTLYVILGISIYISILIIISIYSYKKTNNSDDFLIGDRQFGTILSGLSTGASDMSAWILLGLPGSVYISGLSVLWVGIGLVIGQMTNILLIAKKVRVYSSHFNSITIPDYLEKRLQDPSGIIKSLSSIIIIFFFSIYIASSLVASGRILEYIFKIKYIYGLLISILVIGVQAVAGGFNATTITDVFQALFISFTLLCVILITMILIQQEDIYKYQLFVNDIYKHSSKIFNITYLEIISSLSWGLGYFGQPHILIRFQSMRNAKDYKGVFYICISWMIITFILAFLIGLISHAYFYSNNMTAPNPENSLLYISQYSMGAFGLSIVVMSIFSATMSTANSQLIVISGIFIKDIIQIFGFNNISSLIANRLIISIISLISLFIAIINNTTIIALVKYSWGGLGASIGALIVLTTISKEINWKGGIACILTGFIFIIFFNIIKNYTGVYELLPAYIIATFTGYYVSIYTGKSSSQLKKELIIND